MQSSVVLTAIRERKPMTEIKEIAAKVSNLKSISNEKIKQKKEAAKKGDHFDSVIDLKEWVNESDKFLIYRVDQCQQLVFKSSKAKLKLAKNMDVHSDHYLSEEFCYSDGKDGRTKELKTLTASVYHSLLKKQITLATMECKDENTNYVEMFWRIFNEAFKDVNETDEKFNPIGWCSDMAGSNFNGLKRIYGDDVLQKMKGWLVC